MSDLMQASEMGFYKQISDLLADARRFAKRQLDSTIVATYYEMGRMIVEREQQGQQWAQYGKNLIKELCEYLTARYGRGFSVANLKSIRKSYRMYVPAISQTTVGFSAENQIGQTLSALFRLSWSQYQLLMRIDNADARRFYEIEAINQQWSYRALQWQVDSSLYERRKIFYM